MGVFAASEAGGGRAHQRVATIVGGLSGLLVALFVVRLAVQVDVPGLLDALVLLVTAAAAVMTLWLVARHFDRVDPQASLMSAGLRLLVPGLALVVVCWWTIDRGMFEKTDLGRFVVAPVAIALVGGAFLLGSLLPVPSRTAPGSADQIPSPRPDVPRQRTILHRLVSGLITAAWVPFGLFALFAFNYCPDEGEATKMLVLSFIFVAAQLLGNAVAGWLLDRRYGSEGGFFVCLGRSVLVAIILLVGALAAVGAASALIGPHGASKYCG